MRNPFLLTGVVISIAALVPFFFYILPKQLAEVRRPPSILSRTRFRLFWLEVMLVLAIVPGIPRTIQLLSIPAVNDYAKLVSITNRLPYLIIAVILVMIYSERIKVE